MNLCVHVYNVNCKSSPPSLLQSLSDFKLALRQQSADPVSSTKEALGLCRAVHKFHFQLLVLLGSYVKLISVLDKPMETSPVSKAEHSQLYYFACLQISFEV